MGDCDRLALVSVQGRGMWQAPRSRSVQQSRGVGSVTPPCKIWQVHPPPMYHTITAGTTETSLSAVMPPCL